MVEDLAITALLNIEVEVNLIKESFILKVGLTINDIPNSSMVHAIGNQKVEVVGIILRVEVSIREIKVFTSILVVKIINQPLILSTPFLYRAAIVVKTTLIERVNIKFSSINSSRKARFIAINFKGCYILIPNDDKKYQLRNK